MSSLQERAAARREQLQQERSFVLPLQGYEDMFAVRYRALSYDEVWKVGKRNEALGSTPEGDLASFADLIINGCVEFLEVKDDGSYVSLGHKWTADGVGRSFGLDLPEGASARDAVFAVFSGPQGGSLLAMHANAYDSELGNVLPQVDEEAAGEPEPSVEGSSTSPPTPPPAE